MRVQHYFFAILMLVSVCQFCMASPRDEVDSIDQQETLTSPADVYSTLVADTIRGLLEELLVIGLFVVGVGHFVHRRHKPSYYYSREFRNRIVLLVAVVLFVTYLRLTYFVESEQELRNTLAQARSSFDFWQSNKAAWMVILLTPLDLLAIVCLVGMFLAVAGSEFFGGENRGEQTIESMVRGLYLFTGLTHAEFVLAWVALRLFTGEIFAGWADIAYHILFACLHVVGYLHLRRAVRRDPTNARNNSDTIQNHVYFYAALAIGVYLTRLWWYVALRYT